MLKPSRSTNQVPVLCRFIRTNRALDYWGLWRPGAVLPYRRIRRVLQPGDSSPSREWAGEDLLNPFSSLNQNKRLRAIRLAQQCLNTAFEGVF
jgi:hypothetical protein